MTGDDDDDDFVTFVEFATDGRSDFGDYSSSNTHDTYVVRSASNDMSRGNDNVNRLFDAVAIAFCQEDDSRMSWRTLLVEKCT